MPKIKLNKKLWNREKGEEVTVNAEQAEFAVRKGYAEKLDPAAKKRKDKVDPELKKRKTKENVD